ncbi:Lrp/AsnC family transcriptional regulator [Acidocella aminolytica]|jgi:DNA-binding Lrp family transcriptional regulator|uniref:Transcriptional regulator AsnC n=1 Tax=Acidocella aminolytica 101 = DSM 11237 TaxID=1120923 RepID=A0A0D6PFX7_9PROT|nr:Lrp/AsnC family transcriptional regulator [Acidocella aminolytica]GAN79754.1 transcriptional regulator AsnC [Acidocella aminolytica 101 = DSM 11237]GBQ40457.1 transcriptional regulator [Acidocella aminolytica 101 = DSM 11237]SHF54233.1 DNA-binding transcriptional regulator, Lrp family [Acidocella aminolytica 101 = DSM 11237]
MDEIDHRLITLLRHNGRASISELAAELGLSRATVRTRMARLEQAGTILGYTAILKAGVVAQKVRGVMMIEVEGYAADRVVRSLSGFPEVTAIHSTNGRWDLIVELGTETLEDLDVVLRRIRLIQGINNSETNLLLATPRATRPGL